MLEIKSKNGYSYPLNKGTLITLELHNPMFSTLGSHSAGFDLPADPKTLKHLGFPERVDNIDSRTVSDEVFVQIDSWTIGATLQIKSTFDKKLRANLTLWEGDFINRLQGVLLSDLELGGQINMGNLADSVNYMNETLDKGYPERNFALFPIRNLDFWKDLFGGSTWYDDYEYQNMVYEDSGVFKFNSGTIFTPFPYLNLILKDAFIYTGLRVEENFYYNDTERRKLALYNANELHYVNNNGRVVLSEHVPEITFLDTKKAIDNLFNTCLFITNGKGKYLSKQDVVLSPEVIDITHLSSSKFELIREDINGFKLEYESPTNDSFWSDNIQQIEEFRDRIDDPVANVIDLLQYTTLNRFRFVESKNLYYRYAYDDEVGGISWQPFSYDYFNKYDGDQKYSVKTDVSPLVVTTPFTKGMVPGLKEDWITPECLIPGNRLYYHFYRQKREFSLRLMFYRGWQNDALNKPYPLGSGEVYDYSGSKIPEANQSLKWEGEYGLCKTHWEKYLHWWVNIKKLYKTEMSFTPDVLSDLDFSKKYQSGKHKFIIKSIRLPISKHEIHPAKVEMYSV